MKLNLRIVKTAPPRCLLARCLPVISVMAGLLLAGCSARITDAGPGDEVLNQVWTIEGQVLSIGGDGTSFQLQSEELVEDFAMTSDVATVNYDAASELIPGEEVEVTCFKNSVDPGMINRVESVKRTEDTSGAAEPGTDYDVTGEVTAIDVATSTFTLKSDRFEDELGLKSDEVTVSFGHLPDFKLGDRAEISFTPEDMEYEDGVYTITPSEVEKL